MTHAANTIWVCYYRVSTQRKHESGLGLDAQWEAVSRYIGADGSGTMVAEYTEAESGKGASNRRELQKGLEISRKRRATLVIAKLDRLSRNVHFILGLMKSTVNFVAVDQPTKDKLMLHLQAAFAEEEARRIGQRTKEALAVAKRRGVDVGATGSGSHQTHYPMPVFNAPHHAICAAGNVFTEGVTTRQQWTD